MWVCGMGVDVYMGVGVDVDEDVIHGCGCICRCKCGCRCVCLDVIVQVSMSMWVAGYYNWEGEYQRLLGFSILQGGPSFLLAAVIYEGYDRQLFTRWRHVQIPTTASLLKMCKLPWPLSDE